MSTISTHVLDTALGRPAPGIRVTLMRDDKVLGQSVTDVDGRARDLTAESKPLEPGSYRLHFETGAYFEKSGRESFYRDINLDFVVKESDQHYHVPLLLAPFGYSTYRGS